MKVSPLGILCFDHFWASWCAYSRFRQNVGPTRNLKHTRTQKTSLSGLTDTFDI